MFGTFVRGFWPKLNFVVLKLFFFSQHTPTHIHTSLGVQFSEPEVRQQDINRNPFSTFILIDQPSNWSPNTTEMEGVICAWFLSNHLISSIQHVCPLLTQKIYPTLLNSAISSFICCGSLALTPFFRISPWRLTTSISLLSYIWGTSGGLAHDSME